MCQCDYKETRGAVTCLSPGANYPSMHLDMLCVVLVRLKEVKSVLTFRHTHACTHAHAHSCTHAQ